MSIKAIADVLEAQPATVSNWLFRAAKQCEKVNEDLMKDLNISKVEMDELWVPVEKSCTKNRNRTYALEYKIMNNLHCDWFMF